MRKHYLSLGLALVWAVNQILLAMLSSTDLNIRSIAIQAMASGSWALYSCISLNDNGSPATPQTFDACQSVLGLPPAITLPETSTAGSKATGRPHR